MSHALDKLQHELEASQRALAEAEARYVRQEAEHRSAFEEAEKVRKQIEQAHQEWITALDVAEDPIFVHDKDFRILRCNRAYQRNAGIPFQQIIGQPYYEVFPKTHGPLPHCLQAMENAEEETAEEEVIVGDTTYRSRAYSVKGTQGSYLYSVHTLEDINESLQINLSLQESEQQYRRLFEAAREGILMLDAETGKIMDANPFILDLLSYSLSECTAKTLWDIGLFKDVAFSKAAFRELQDKGHIRYENLPLETKDGRQIDVDFVGNIYQVGERKVLQCNIRDNTERVRAKQLLRESEQQYRQLFESAKDGILMLDAESGKITDANPFILEMLAYSLDESIGKMLWEIGLFKDVASSKAAFRELQDNGYIRYEDLPLQTKDGRRIDVEFISNIYDVGDHKVIQCNIRDITERLRAEAEVVWKTAFFETLARSSMDGILVVDSAGEKVLQNQRMIEMWKIPQALAEDPDDTSELQFVMNQTTDPGQFLDKVRYLYDHPEESALDEIATKQGTIFERYSAPVKDDTGVYYGRIWSFHDITERKAAQQQLQLRAQLLDNTADSILAHDLDGNLIYLNEAAWRERGYTHDEMMGMNLRDLDMPEGAKLIKSHINELKKKGSSTFESAHLRKDGTFFPVEVSARLFDLEGHKIILSSIRDISERREAEESLRLFRALLDNSSDGIEVVDPVTLRLLDVNETECRELGYSREELLTMGLKDIEAKFTENQILEFKDQILQNGEGRFESTHRRKDGTTYPVEIMAKIVRIGKPYMLSIVRDITERRQAEQVLQNEKTFSETLIQSLPDIFFLLNRQGYPLRWNKQLEWLLGLSPEEVPETNVLSIVHEDDRPRAIQAIQQAFEEGSASLESRLDLATGIRDYLLTATRIETRLGVNLIGFGVDITERKRTEAQLQESEEKFRAIFDHTSDGIIVMDIVTRVVKFANASMEQMLGYEPGELSGLAMAQLHPPEALSQVGEQFEQFAGGSKGMVQDMPMLTRDGRVLYADLNGSPVDIGGHRYLLGAFRDATQRRAVEMKLRRANRALQTLSAGNLALVQAENEDGLLRSITRVIVEQGGYSLAVVDYAKDDPERTITPMAWTGFEGSDYWAEHLSWADTERGQLPVSRAIRSGKTQVCHDIPADASFNPWREALQAHDYLANIALPFRDDGKIFGCLSIYSSDTDAFDGEEIKLLEKLADDLAYGIVTLRNRRAQEQHELVLRQSLEQFIQTIADTVQARDPYTAGHQQRVSELAVAIAREMGLPEDQIRGIHFAGIIHDLGKIRIPLEILSYPGKLTDVEFELVKQHPQAGYDIIKKVQFPWPIADIVLQHHERMDGSGYPQGLKGDAILIEARIITVADVVEAMSSHRPYRPGRGIEAGLDEISKMRGVYYDPHVVDACLSLFREKNYVLPT